jgi:glutathione S-transferase
MTHTVLSVYSFPELTEFTCPTIRLADGETYIMDSAKIAAHLEQTHPTPSAHLDSPTRDALKPLMIRVLIALQGLYIPLIPQRILPEASIPFFESTRKEHFGMSLKEVYEKYAPDAWEKAQEPLREMTALLTRDDGGPFFDGKEVGYADFTWVGMLMFFKDLDRDGDIWGKVADAAGDGGRAFEALLEGVRPWSERRSH